MTSTIALGGETFYGEFQDEPGVLHFSDLSDWYSGSNSKTDIRENPEGDGAFDIDREWRSSLPMSIEGWCEAGSWATAERIILRMRSNLIPKTMRDMEVTSPAGITARKVSIRRLQIRENPAEGAFDFGVDVVATDPSMYGPAVVTSTGLPTISGGLAFPLSFPLDLGDAGDPGRLTTANPGSSDAFTDFEVTGGTIQDGFAIVNVTTGRRLVYDTPLLAGQIIYFDSRTSEVYVGSPENDVASNLTTREWWAVPPATSYDVQFEALGAVTGTPILTARTRPAL